jgi:hypothetical protein
MGQEWSPLGVLGLTGWIAVLIGMVG